MWAERRLTQQLNQNAVDYWKPGIYGQIIQDAHERLSAADPDYEIGRIWTAPSDDGLSHLLHITYHASKHSTFQDWEIMDAIISGAEHEALLRWRHVMAMDSLDPTVGLKEFLNDDCDYGMDCD